MWCTPKFGCINAQGLGLLGGSSITGLILGIIQLLLVFGTVGALIFLLIGGIRWITSSGDKQGLAAAKGTVTYALVGLILLFLTFLIIRFVSGFFGFDLGAGVPHPPTLYEYSPPVNF